MDIHLLINPVIRIFRKKRMQRLTKTFPHIEKVIDLGGSGFNWKLVDYSAQITLVNLDPQIAHDGMTLLLRDACDTSLPDQSFSLAFSNSLIEHLSSIERQHHFAREMHRLAPHLWCQTPNKWFPIEPHLWGLLIHWLPQRFQFYWLIRYCTVWGLITKPSRKQVADFKNEVRLLTKHEMQTLFPDCDIITERFLGLPKSFIAVKRVTSVRSLSQSGESAQHLRQ